MGYELCQDKGRRPDVKAKVWIEQLQLKQKDMNIIVSQRSEELL